MTPSALYGGTSSLGDEDRRAGEGEVRCARGGVSVGGGLRRLLSPKQPKAACPTGVLRER
jgi:hypothetical protein